MFQSFLCLSLFSILKPFKKPTVVPVQVEIHLCRVFGNCTPVHLQLLFIRSSFSRTNISVPYSFEFSAHY